MIHVLSILGTGLKRFIFKASRHINVFECTQDALEHETVLQQGSQVDPVARSVRGVR